jgi:hypothetical protein
MSDGLIEDAPQTYDGPAIPVYMDPSYTATEEIAPDYGSTMTYAIPQFGVGTPLQVLTRRLRRHKAYVEVNFTLAGSVIFNSKIDQLSSQSGYTVAVPVAGLYRLPDWESQQPLYVIATVAGLSVSVIDFSYSER